MPVSSPALRFGPYEIDFEGRSLRKFGYRIRLQPKSFLVLRALLDRPGELVTREDLKAQLWPENTFVEFESSLNVAVRRLREALGDEAQNPVYIETVPRAGYRFIGVVEAGSSSDVRPALTLNDIREASSDEGLVAVPAGLESEVHSGHDLPLAIPHLHSPIAFFWKYAVPVVVLLLAIVAGVFVWRQETPRALAAGPSIAVLPFADMSPDKNQQYLSDGLAEELLNHLAKTPGLRVAARSSSFQFKGKTADLHAIGDKLNVNTVLEGSVRKDGDRVRISAELVKIDDGFQLWSGSYDRNLKDVMTLQEEIARAITSELKVRLLTSNVATVAERNPNTEAYNDYLQGRYFFERRSVEDLSKATYYYEQAINLDPGYARAWSGLAWVRMSQADSANGLSFEDGYRLAREAAQHALQLDPNLAEAHAAIGRIKRTNDWDWTGADQSFQKAIVLEPQNTIVLVGASSLAASLGRFDEAVALSRRVVELDPLSITAYISLGMHAYYAGQMDLAISAYRKALEINPEDPSAHYLLSLVWLSQGKPQDALTEVQQQRDGGGRGVGEALAYFAMGHKQEADATLDKLVSRYSTEAAYQIAEVFAFRGENDRAFEWLEKAYAQRDAGLAAVKGDPLLKNLWKDPRYSAFLKKLHLPA